jgi:UDP-GlcNAc:undecaprenyl-phosphate GlcNAc-1-phosphate transferase
MDYQLILAIVTAFFLACTSTYFVTPCVIRFAKHYGLVDNPKKRFHPAHTHKGIIPRAGGLALLSGIIITSFIILPMNRLLISILISSIILVIVGLLDDKKDINPYVRLATNGVAALIVIIAGIGVPYITNPFTGGIISLSSHTLTLPFLGVHSILLLADCVAFIWIMWTMSIIGWSSGVDGQMPGFVAIAALVLGILSLRFSVADPTQIPVTLLAFIVTGAFAGFIPWNFYPQKIMPGYGGKTLAGFFLALLGILSYAKLGTALLVLGVPMIDAVYTLVRRFIKRSSPVLADRGHLHHKLLELGWGRRRIALFYWGVSAILGIIALSVKSQQKMFALLLFSVIIGGFLLWVNFFSHFSKQQDQDNG